MEEVVVSGLYAAFPSENKTLTTDHLLQAARQIVPLSRARQAEIARLRAWAETNTRPAALPPEEASRTPTDDASRRRDRLIDF